MEKTYSQELAGDFESACYLLLIPASVGVLLSVNFIKSATWFTALIFAVFFVGLILLVGYHRHARNRLSSDSVRLLWLASAVYNFLLFIPCAVFGLVILPAAIINFMSGGIIYYFIFAAITVSYFAAGQSSMKAYLIERKQSRLSRNDFLRQFDRIESC